MKERSSGEDLSSGPSQSHKISIGYEPFKLNNKSNFKSSNYNNAYANNGTQDRYFCARYSHARNSLPNNCLSFEHNLRSHVSTSLSEQNENLNVGSNTSLPNFDDEEEERHDEKDVL